jgi:flagella basal body P-ring formation protein FlgA
MGKKHDHGKRNWAVRVAVTLGIVLLVADTETSSAQTVISLKEAKRLEGATVVRLGDIAWVKDRQPKIAAALEQLELFPLSRDEMVVTREQVRDRLGLLGVNLHDVHWEGARHIKLSSRATLEPKSSGVVPVSSTENFASSRTLGWQNQQLERYVQQQLGSELLAHGLELESAEITDGGRQALGGFQNFGSVLMSGEIQEGENQAVVEVGSGGESQRVSVRIYLTACQQAVFLKAGLSKGDVIQASDFELRPISSDQRYGNVVTNPADVVGKELVYGVKLNQPMTRSMVRERIYVQSNRTVLVEHSNGNIRVKTYGTARQSGGLGDVVRVEVGEDQRKLLAEVVGEDRVEVKLMR